MTRRPPRATLTDNLFANTTLYRAAPQLGAVDDGVHRELAEHDDERADDDAHLRHGDPGAGTARDGEPVEHSSEEHTSELQSLMRISYAVFCLKKKKNKKTRITTQ